ncbi:MULTISPECIES: lipopolysaccharide biosynthesis protein [Bacteroides]|jgi:hypothetical protein|uniref:lipopolysaccharide biosynthesis protein n=1 Tax=Bacteroides TaxID=816 RepID=UPI000374629D|nr:MULTISPECIES: lipopolysaccharide biosynthesis protein [Bacteroides]EOA58197.1 hypothetical protein HMPREF1214_02291 [Bacteroides sp. HPS0048]
MKYTNVYIWSGIDRLGTACISFLCNIVLARLLSTDDFGIIGMVAIFFSIAYSFTDCGLSDGLIKMEAPRTKDYGTVFVFNLSVGTIIAILFIVTAYPIAEFFNEQKLVSVIQMLGIALLLHSMTFVEETRLRKELKMRYLAIVKLIASFLASLCSIGMAFHGWGYLSLAYLQLLIPLFILLGFIFITHWRPLFYFNKQTFRTLWGYGHHLLITFFINQTGRNLNSFILGKTSTAHTVGLYAQAQKLQEVPMMIIDSIICNTSYPVLSNMSDPNEKTAFIKKLTKRVIFINVSVTTLLYIMAPFLIRFFYGVKWEMAIPIFRALLIVGLLLITKSFLQTLLKSYGAFAKIKLLAFIEIGFQVLLVLVTFKYGIYAIIGGQALALAISIILHYIFFVFAKKSSHGI